MLAYGLLGRREEILEGGVGTSSEVSTEMIGIGSWALPGAVDTVDLGSTPLQEQPELVPFGPSSRILVDPAPIEEPPKLGAPVA